ncbi:hypothetical protein D3C87_964230 [compost metagenome]
MSEKLVAELLADVSNYVRNMRLAASESLKTSNTIDKATDSISNAFTSKISGAFSAAAVISFTKSVIDASAEYQKFDAVLSNTLGSQALASIKMQELATFAAQTPFGINELTASFVKLANAGFKPTGDEMRKLGDLASSTGKSFDQLAEAILDAQTGEFERLKEFGVRAKDAGDSVIFTYKGVQTQVEKTSGAIREYITNLGAAEGTSGSMAKISETLGGKISNLGDNWDQMLISVGKNTDGVFTASINVISEAISKITQYNNELNTVNKFKLGNNTSEFFKQLNRAVNPFAGKGATDLEKQVANINLTKEALNAFVSKTVSGAKNVNDFSKALADLKLKSDLTRSLTSVGRFTDAVSKKGLQGSFEDIRKTLPSLFVDTKAEANAIQQVYQEAINAVIDARRNFSKEAKSDANFGTAKKGKKDKVSIPTTLEAPENAATIAKEFTKNFKSLTGLEALKVEVPKVEFVGDLKPIELPPFVAFDAAKQKLKADTEAFLEEAKSEVERLLSFKNLVNVASEAMGNGFQAIGSALVNGNSIIESAGSAFLSTISGFIAQLGQALIKQGIATVAAGIALNFIVPGSGAKQIAGGAGLIAAGGAMSIAAGAGSAFANSKSGQSNSNSAQQQSGPKYKQFANGGIVHSPTFAQVGEYAGASSNPEVIAPLNKLKSMLPKGQEGAIIPKITLRGEDIVIAFNRANKRLGGLG